MVACSLEAKRAFYSSNNLGWFANGIVLGLLGSVAGFQVASLVHYILGDPEPMLIFWIFMGSAIVLRKHAGQVPVERNGMAM